MAKNGKRKNDTLLDLRIEQSEIDAFIERNAKPGETRFDTCLRALMLKPTDAQKQALKGR